MLEALEKNLTSRAFEEYDDLLLADGIDNDPSSSSSKEQINLKVGR